MRAKKHAAVEKPTTGAQEVYSSNRDRWAVWGTFLLYATIAAWHACKGEPVPAVLYAMIGTAHLAG